MDIKDKPFHFKLLDLTQCSVSNIWDKKMKARICHHLHLSGVGYEEASAVHPLMHHAEEITFIQCYPGFSCIYVEPIWT